MSGRLRLYVQLVVGIGGGLIVHSLFGLRTTPRLLECLLFAGLSVLTGSFTLAVASVPASISVSDTFFLTIALLFGPAAATVTVAADSLLMSWRKRHGIVRVVFNTTENAISLWIASHVFFLLLGGGPLIGRDVAVSSILVPLLCLTALYYVLNSTMTAIAVGLETGQSVLHVWRLHFLWLAVNYMAAGSAAFCLVLLVGQIGAGAIAVMLPVLAVFHLTLRASFGRLDDARRHLGDMDRLYLSTVETLAMAIDAKDDVTHSHVRRVQRYAMGLAKELGVGDEPTLKAIEAAALLHDTGKLAVPEHILNKPGKLTESEFETMKLHVDVGADILSLVDFPYPVVPIVRCHHENWDGTGYPRGVAAEAIPIGARILSVVDCFDALTSDRPYRPAMTSEAAFDILRARRGTMYDPTVVDRFIAIQPQIAPEEEAVSQRQQVLAQISAPRRAHGTRVEAEAQTAAVVSEDVLAFVSLSRLAAGEQSVADVLALASNLLGQTTAQCTATWFIVDPVRNQLEMLHASGPAAALFRGMTMAIGTRVTGWVAANKQPMINADPTLDVGGEANVGASLQSCLSVPLMNGDALVGVLTLYSPQPRAFSDDQGRMIQMIAPHVASAIGRARRTASAEVGATASADKPVSAPLRLVATR